MTSKRSFKDYLQDMLVAAEDAMQFVAGMDFTTFEQDKRTTYAVIRAIEIIGEATKRIPDEVNQVIVWNTAIRTSRNICKYSRS